MKSPESALRELFLTHPYGVDSEKPRFSFKFASQISRRFAPWFSFGKQTRTARARVKLVWSRRRWSSVKGGAGRSDRKVLVITEWARQTHGSAPLGEGQGARLPGALTKSVWSFKMVFGARCGCFSSPTPYGVDSEKPRFSFKFASQISRRCAPWFSFGKQTRTANRDARIILERSMERE